MVDDRYLLKTCLPCCNLPNFRIVTFSKKSHLWQIRDTVKSATRDPLTSDQSLTGGHILKAIFFLDLVKYFSSERSPLMKDHIKVHTLSPNFHIREVIASFQLRFAHLCWLLQFMQTQGPSSSSSSSRFGELWHWVVILQMFNDPWLLSSLKILTHGRRLPAHRWSHHPIVSIAQWLYHVSCWVTPKQPSLPRNVCVQCHLYRASERRSANDLLPAHQQVWKKYTSWFGPVWGAHICAKQNFSLQQKCQ